MQEKHNKRLKQIMGIVAVVVAIIALQFGISKFVFNKENTTELNFYEYRIAPNEILISPETYTGEEVTVTITTQKPGLSIQYQLGEDGEWIDYTGPFSVDDNVKVNTRLVSKEDNFEGPVTDKDITNIAVAKIGDTYYKTLESAISACPENAGNSQTKIEMLTNVTESVVIPEGKNVILDLCGNNVKAKQENTITVNGKFNLVDSVGGGELTSDTGAAIDVSQAGSFTLGTNESEPSVSETNPVINSGTYGVIVEDGGEFNFYDGIITGATKAISGTVTDTAKNYVVVASEQESKEVAVLKRTYVIEYDKNSDTAEIEYTTETRIVGEELGRLPTATKDGYLFKGWYTLAEGGEQITINTIVASNVTYYAQWEAYSYTIIYNANGGTGTTSNTTCKYDEDVTLRANGFIAPEGYTFKEWNTLANGTGTKYQPLNIVKNLTNTQSGIVNLYAIWEDTIAPGTEAPTATSTTNSITVTCNQTDKGTGIDESTIEYSIYINGEWSDWQTSNVFEGLYANTQYTVKTRVTDNNGNGPVESEETVIPTKNIQIGTIEIHENTPEGEEIIPTTNKDDDSNQVNTDLYIDVTPTETGTTTITVKNPDGTTNTYTEDSTIITETGVYEITVETTDGTNAVSETYYVYVDKTAPIVEPTNTKTTNTITVDSNAVDNESGIDTITYELKKGDDVIATNTTGEFTGLDDNTEYTVTITATDKAGNTTTVTETIRTNTLIPGNLTFEETPSNTEFTPSADIWINEDVITTLIPGSAGTTTYEVTAPDGSKTTYSANATIPTVNGTYNIKLTTTDGKNTETVDYTFNVDKTAPTVEYGTNGGTYSIPVGSTTYTISSKITGADEGGSGLSQIEYAWNTSNTEEPSTWTTLTDNTTVENNVTGGTHYLWVKTTDNAGNVTITKTSAFEVGYTIEYNSNGGTGTVSSQRKVHGTNITLNNGEALSKTGYTFIGWAETANATEIKYGKNASYTENKSVRLYAVWQANTYNINYVLNNGTNNTNNPSTYTYGKEVTLSNATKLGYTFEGWYTDSSFTNKITSISPTQTGDITVYAKFNTITYTITYNLEGGSLGTGVTNPANYTTETSSFTLNNPSKTGYSFNGWTGGVINAQGEVDNTAVTGTSGNITTPTKNVIIKLGSIGNRKYTANWIDDIAPSTDAPNATSTTSTITVVSNQTDDGTGVTDVKYSISEDGVTWSEWQDSDTFEGLESNKTYYVKTRATDEAGNTSESDAKEIKTENLGAGSLAFYKNDINGEIIVAATTEDGEKPWVNSDLYVAMTRGTNGTTTYEVIAPDGTKTTYTNNDTIPTVTGEYTITVITTDGDNTVTKTYYINVDKELPTVTFGTNGGTYTIPVGATSQSASTTVTAQDLGGSELSKVEYAWSKDSGATPTEWITTTNGGEITENLEGGTNYLWIKATDKAGNETIQISNDFNVGYEVKYNSNNGTGTIESHRKADGVTLKLSDGTGFTREGYTLIGWARSSSVTSAQYNLSGNFTLNAPTTLYAVWQANTNTNYTVEFYNQANGTYLATPTRTEKRTGTTDTTVSVTDEDKTAPNGYTYDSTAANVESGKVAGNGSLVLKVYFKQQFTITYKPGTQGTFETTTFEGLDYGMATPEYTGSKTGNAGYTFSGWLPEVAQTVTANTEYVAQWAPNTNTAYKVEHYKQTLTGTYELAETENKTGTTDETVTAVAKQYDGFTENTSYSSRIPTGTIAGDGSLVLKLYYDRNSYDLKINHYVQNADDNNFTLVQTQTDAGKVFGSTVTLNTKKIDIENATYSYGTDSNGNTQTVITIASSNNEINLYYVRNTATLTIHHYVENANNAEYTLQNTEEIDNIRIGATITLENYKDDSIQNVTFDSVKTATSTTMSADGTTIDLYYSRNTYVLTLANNENISEVKGAGTYKWGQSVSISATVASATGYTYAWEKWTSNDSTLLADQTSRTATITMPAGNVTLTASATKKANTYSIVYNANGGTGETASTECTYDVNATISDNSFIGPEGYKGFVKWNTLANGTGTSYNPGDIVKNLSSVQGSQFTLYAIWEDIDAPGNEAPSAIATTNTITVTCNQKDSGSGINTSTIQYSIYKDGSWSEWQDSNVFTGLDAETEYKIKTKAYDNSGNGPTESSEGIKSTTSIELGTLEFRKDSSTGTVITAPTDEPENPTYINNNIYIDVTPGQIGTTTYTVKSPDGTTTTYSNDELVITKTGKYEITITTTDGVNSPSETYYIYVDKTLPTVAPTYTKTTNSITVTPNAQDADSGIDQITYTLKNGDNVIETNTTGKFTGLNDGVEYTVITTVTDKAGNSESKTDTVKTNTLTPGSLTFKETPSNTEFTPSADIWVNEDVLTTLVQGSAGTTTYEVTSPDGSKTTYSANATIPTVDGKYNIVLTTTDETNTKTVNYTFNVDRTNPAVTFGTNGGTYTIPVGSTKIQISSKVTGTDEGGSGIAKVEYAWSSSNIEQPTQWTGIENETNASLQATGGKQYLWVKATDNAGNEYVTKTAVFDVGYAIEYDVNGGNGTVASQRKVHGTSVTLNSGASLSKTGYTFGGWATSSTATSATYAGGASYTSNSSVKLYAVWQINTYTITYDLGGGNLEEGKTNPTTYNVNTETITLNNPTNISKPGYNFVGWTGSNGTTPSKTVTIAKGSTGNKTYTANWEAKTATYTVEHYKENLDGTYAKVEADTESLTAGINTQVTATYKTYTGFNSNTSHANKIETGTVAEDGSLVLKLYYSRKTITVIYNYEYNGGTSATKTSATLKYGAAVDLTATATKANYTFVGWNTSKDATTKLNSLTADTSNITLYAIYSKVINVTYNKNGGTADITQNYTMFNNQTSLTITYPTTPTTYSGWTFECFGDSATSTTGYAAGSTRTVTIASATKSLIYYHNWSKEITFTFIDYSGTTKTTRNVSSTVYNGNKANITAPAQNTYTGWTSLGWTTSTSNTAESLLDAAGGSISNVTANATYYGLYSKDVKVTFNDNGDLVTNIDAQTVTSRTNSYAISTTNTPTITIPANDLVKPGYTYNGKWNNKIDGSGTSYTSGTEYTFTANTTLYPEYVIDNYSINYNLDGGSLATGVTNPSSYNVTSSDIKLNDPTKIGYVFNGWNETIKSVKWSDGFLSYETGEIEDSPVNPKSIYSEPILLKAGNTYTASVDANIRWRIYNLDGSYVGSESTVQEYTPTSDCYAIVLYYSGLTETQKQSAVITVQDPILEVTISAGSTGNREYTAVWDTDTVKYTVYHYLENANDSNYTLYKTEKKDGETNATITLANEKITIANSTYKQGSLTAGGTAVTTTTVASDSSTKIYLYYTRNTYELTLSKNTYIASVAGAGTYKWGQTVNISATLGSASGYTYKWTNWTSSDTTLLANQTEQAATITMPAGAVTLTANATRTVNKYTVTYNYTQNGGDSCTATTKSVTYNTAVDLTPTATKENYLFVGWNTSATATTALTSYTMPANNVTLYAIFKKAVAKIESGNTTTYYATLQDAIDAAGTSATTIIMVDDVSLATTVGTVASGENIVLDLNGHTIETKGEDVYVIRNTGNLEIKDSVEGGKLTSTTSNVVYNSGSGKLVLTSGTIEGGSNYGIHNNTTATFEMNGGNLTSENRGIYNIDSAEVVVNSGSIETTHNSIYNTTGTIEINGGNIYSTSNATINNYNEGTVTISAGTITSGGTYGVYNNQTGTINVSGGNITGDNGVYNNGEGTIIVTGGTINGTTDQGVRGGTGTVTISGSSTEITGVTYGVSVKTGTATITAGTIEATGGPGVYVAGGTLTLGTNESTPSVSTTVPNITGSTYGARVVSGTFNFYDGVIKSTAGAETSINGTVADVPTGYGINKTVATVNSVKTETAILVEANYAEYTSDGTFVKYYATLADAMTNVINGNTIKPLVNRTEITAPTLASGKTATIDLNEKNIILNGVTLTNNGTMTVTGTGTLTGSGASTVTNTRTFKKTGTGTITNTETATYYAISNTGAATLSEGTVSGSYRAISNSGTGKLTVSGATVTAENYAIYSTSTASGTSSPAVKVSGGKVESSTAVVIYNDGSGTIYITGGTIDKKGAGSAILNNKTGTVQISGANAIVTKTGSSYGINNVSTGTIKVTAGTITAEDSSAIYNTAGGIIQISGGTIVGGTNGIYNNGEGTINITAGTITGNTDAGVKIGTGTGTISSSSTKKITGKTYGVSITTGTATITAGTIEATEGIGVEVDGGTLTLGTNETTPSVSTTNPSITGKTYGVNVKSGIFNFYDGVIKGQSGEETSINGIVADVPTNYEIRKTVETVDNITIETAILVRKNYAEYEGTQIVNYYSTLADAMTYVTSGNTIKPLVDRTESTSATLASEKTVTLDLNEKRIKLISKHSLTNNGTMTITGAGTLTGVDASTVQNTGTLIKTGEGTIENTSSDIFAPIYNSGTATLSEGTLSSSSNGVRNQETGTLTLSGATITSTGYGINNYGTVTITSGTINTTRYAAIINYDDGMVYVNGGTITSNARGIYNNETGTITVTKGTITGSSGIYNLGKGTINITGGTITGSTDIGVDIGTGTGTIGTNETTPSVSTTVPSITGKKYGVEVESSGTFNFYDGVIIGQSGAGTSINGTETDVPTGYGARKTTSTVDNVEIETAILVPANYAEYKGTKMISCYTTLVEAMTNVTNGNTIKPLVDITEKTAPTLETEKTATIDLNGKTITLSGVTLTNNGTLTIKDAVGSGMIVNTSTTSSANIINNTGTLKLEGEYDFTIRGTSTNSSQKIINNTGTAILSKGTIEQAGVLASDGTSYRYIVNNSGEITISGATIRTTSDSTTIYDRGVYGISSGTILMTSGEITTKGAALITNSSANTEVNPALGVTGGKITSTAHYAILNSGSSDGLVYINGADVQITGYSCGIYNYTNRIVKISQGTITSTNSDAIINRAEGTVNIDGGTLTVDNENSAVANNGSGRINVTGGTITSSKGSGINNSSDGTINITEGYITGNTSGVYNNGEGIIHVTSGMITSRLEGIHNNSTGEVNYLGGTITAGAVGIYNNTTGEINHSGGMLSGSLYGIYNNSTGTATITGGTIESSEGQGVYVNGGTLTIGTNETTPSVSITVPSITGRTYGVNVESGTFNFYDGVIRGKSGVGTAINGIVTAMPTGYGIRKTLSTVNSTTTETATLVYKNYAEYTSDGTFVSYYATLENALSYVTNGNTIKPLVDVTETIAAELPSGKTAIIDLNEKTITLSGVTLTNNSSATMTITGTGTLTASEGNTLINKGTFTKTGKGEITSTSISASIVYYAIVNSGTATLSEGTISGSYRAVSHSGTKTLTVSGATIKGSIWGINNTGTARTTTTPAVKITSGTIESEINAVKNASTGMVYVTGGELSGINVGTGTGTITGGTITSTGAYGVQVNGGTLTIGTNETTPSVSTTNPSITGKTYGVNVISGKFNFYDGVIKGQSGEGTSINGTVTAIPTGYAIKKTLSTVNSTTTETAILVSKNYAEYTSDGTLVSYYATLADAMKDVRNGNTIKPLANKTETIAATLESGKTATIDLNGKTITLSGVTLTNNGTMTVKDAVGSGMIVNTSTTSSANIINNTGTLKLEGDKNFTIRGTSTNNSQKIINNTGTAILSKGTIEQAGVLASDGTSYRYIVNNSGEITISGATIQTTSASTTIYDRGVHGTGSGTILMTSGEVKTKGAAMETSSSANTEANPALKVTGGKITSTAHYAILSSGSSEGLVYINGADVQINGYTYGIYNFSDRNVKISQGNITSTSASAIMNYAEGTVNIEGGTITSSENSVYNEATGNINVSGGTITGKNGVYNNGEGIIIVTGGTIKGTTDQGIRGGTGTVTISGSSTKITGVTYGVSVRTGTATITAGTIEAKGGPGVYVAGGTLTLGTNESTPSVSTTVPNITGSTYGARVVSGTFNFYDGVIKSTAGVGSSINGTVANVPTGYGIRKTTSTLNGVTTETAILVIKNYEEYAGTELRSCYTTLADAMTNVINGNTIKPVVSRTETVTPTLASGKTATIDLNGKTITLNSITLINNGIMTITGTGTLTGSAGDTIANRGTFTKTGTGTIANTSTETAYAINNIGTVNLNAGTISSIGRAIGNAGTGAIVIDGATVTSTDIAIFNAGELNTESAPAIRIKSGTIKSTSAYGIYNYEGTASGAIYITGGTIEATGTNGVGIYLNRGTLIVGTNETTPSVSTTVPSITGKNYGVRIMAGQFYFYDGVIKGQSGAETSISGTVAATPPGYGIRRTLSTVNSVTTETSILVTINYVEYKGTEIVNYYTTLSDAMTNVTSGNTIKPLVDRTETTAATLASGKTATIDLNEKTITLSGVTLTNNGTMTITGTGIGTLTGSGANTVTNTGTFTKTGTGTITNTAASTYYAISNTGTATLSAGTVSGSYRAISNSGTGKLTVSGATLTARNYAIYNTSTASGTSSPAVKVSSGTVESTTAVVIYNDGIGFVYITGGTINKEGSGSAIVNNKEGTVQISGSNAIVNKTGSSYALNNVSTGTIKVTAGTITAETGNAIFNTAEGTIQISGGTIVGGTNGIYNNGKGIINITAGTITGTANAGIRVGTGTLTLGTSETTPSVSTTVPNITGKTYGVTVGSGTFNFYDGVIKGQSGAGTSISGTVAAMPTGYTIQKTTASGVETAILVKSTSTASVESTANTMSLTSMAKTKVKDVSSSINNSGNVENNDIDNATNIDIQQETDIDSKNEISENTSSQTDSSENTIIAAKKVAKVAEATYPTLAEAIEAANNGDEIELLEEISLNDAVTIDKGKNIKLNLNGKTITSLYKNTIVNNGTVSIVSNGIIRNETDNGIVIINNGTLNMENGVITTNANGGKSIYNEGTLKISGGKVVTEGIGGIGIYNSNKSKLTIKGGIIEVTGYGSKCIYNNSSVVIGADAYSNAGSSTSSTTQESTINSKNSIKIIVSGDDSIGIFNSKDATICDIKSGEIIIEAEVIENYELIKNTNEFKAELEEMKPSYGIYNDSNISVNIEGLTMKVERLKGVGIQNNAGGAIVFGIADETLNLANPIVYAIEDYTTVIINVKTGKGKIKFYDGSFITIKSMKDEITDVLENYEIVENEGNSVISTILKKISKKINETESTVETNNEITNTVTTNTETSNTATTDTANELNGVSDNSKTESTKSTNKTVTTENTKDEVVEKNTE